MNFKKLFVKIDLLGQEFNFENENNQRYRTVEGAIFSIVIFVIAIVIAFLFGQEVYQRKHPNRP